MFTISRPLLAAATLLLAIGCGTLQDRWEETRARGTIAAYEAFLGDYPQDERTVQAREHLAGLYRQRAWEEAAGQDTLAAYQAFLAKHPEGEQAAKARARLRTLAPQPGGSPSETNHFTDRFLKRHGHVLAATDRPGTGEALAFAEAQQRGTIAAYETFLRQFPGGERAAEAQRNLEALLFQETQTEDTLAAYEGYLQRYPQGTFAGEARSRREKLAGTRLMTPRRRANIRAARSVNARLRGQLQAGDLVRTDFLRDGWYAVFSPTEKEPAEERALGYVHASLLVPAAASPGGSRPGTAAGGPPPPLPRKAAQEPPVTVLDLSFQATGDGRESLRITFDRHYLPVLAGIEGATPQIVIELRNANPIPPRWAAVETEGKMVRRIFGRTDAGTQSAQIVLEMDPARNYAVRPVYYERDHVYLLEVSEVK